MPHAAPDARGWPLGHPVRAEAAAGNVARVNLPPDTSCRRASNPGRHDLGCPARTVRRRRPWTVRAANYAELFVAGFSGSAFPAGFRRRRARGKVGGKSPRSCTATCRNFARAQRLEALGVEPKPALQGGRRCSATSESGRRGGGRGFAPQGNVDPKEHVVRGHEVTARCCARERAPHRRLGDPTSDASGEHVRDRLLWEVLRRHDARKLDGRTRELCSTHRTIILAQDRSSSTVLA